MSSRPQGKNLTLKRGTRCFVPQYDKEGNKYYRLLIKVVG